VPDVTGVPSAEELAALPHDELAARLAEAYRAIAGLTARVELLERRAGRDSLLTEQGPVFPQLEGLAVALGCTVTARG
jgi:hypothetical protein